MRAEFGPSNPEQALNFDEGQAAIKWGDFQKVVSITPEDLSNNLSSIVQQFKSEAIAPDI